MTRSNLPICAALLLAMSVSARAQDTRVASTLLLRLRPNRRWSPTRDEGRRRHCACSIAPSQRELTARRLHDRSAWGGARDSAWPRRCCSQSYGEATTLIVTTPRLYRVQGGKGVVFRRCSGVSDPTRSRLRGPHSISLPRRRRRSVESPPRKLSTSRRETGGARRRWFCGRVDRPMRSAVVEGGAEASSHPPP